MCDFKEAKHTNKKTYNLGSEMQLLFSVLDAAIYNMENGRVISEEEMWVELDAIK